MKQPESLGLRHVALKVKDMPAMRNFYVQLLGYNVEWEPDPDNVYLTTGTDNLALHRVNQKTGGGNLDHLGILVRTPADVDHWAAFLEAKGVTLQQGPKTHRDGARSIYFADPDGNVIQIIYHPPISGNS